MANRTKGSNKNNNPRNSSGLRNAILIFPIIAIVGIIWLVLLQLGQLPESLTFEQDIETWVNLWILIFVIVIVILICIPQSGEATPVKETKVTTITDDERKVKKHIKAKPVKMVTIETEDKPVEFVPIAKEKVKRVKDKATEVTTVPTKDDVEIAINEGQETPAKIMSAAVVAMPAEKEKVKPKVIEYPFEVDDGIYGDSFIELSEETVLKLRILVAKDIYLL